MEVKIEQLCVVCQPTIVGTEKIYIEDVLNNPQDLIKRKYLNLCTQILKQKYKTDVFLTTNCTSALEMICLIEGWGKGDEIILPSYTFVSTANAFVKYGITPIFVDIESDTMNIDIEQVEKAITPRTKAIIAVHYGGISCDIDKLANICKIHNILFIEDAAQAYGSYYKDRILGTIGDYGVVSFDQNKVIHAGQGGMLLMKNKNKLSNAQEVYEVGTNRQSFFEGKSPYYSWVSLGGKYVLSDLNCAFLYAQLLQDSSIIKKRLEKWNYYLNNLRARDISEIKLPHVPEFSMHNGYQFYLITENQTLRNKLQQHLQVNNIASSFHFIPLHSSPMGLKTGRFIGTDSNTTRISQNILRIPLHNGISEQHQQIVIDSIFSFFK